MSDPSNLPGLAHFCEHMLFLGTEKVELFLLPRKAGCPLYCYWNMCYSWTSLFWNQLIRNPCYFEVKLIPLCLTITWCKLDANGYLETLLFRTIFPVPWDFEIAGFDCNFLIVPFPTWSPYHQAIVIIYWVYSKIWVPFVFFSSIHQRMLSHRYENAIGTVSNVICKIWWVSNTSLLSLNSKWFRIF